MNKEQYIRQLNNRLKGIPACDRDEVINDVKDYFKEGIRNGRSEEEIARALGNPYIFATTIKMEYSTKPNTSMSGMKNSINVLFLILGLGFVNIMLLPVFFTVGLLLLCLYMIIGSFYFSGVVIGIVGIIKSFYPTFHVSYITVPDIHPSLIVGIGILMVVIAYLVQLVAVPLSKKCYKFLLKYLDKNKAILYK